MPRLPLNPEGGISLFTDGSCWTGDRIGGWAFVAIDAFDGIDSESGGMSDTTISVMELRGPVEGLTYVYQMYGAQQVLVFSDSEYVVLGMQNKSRKRNKNVVWWDLLEEAAAAHEYVEFNHVKGHATSEWNNMADDLAGKARHAARLPSS